MKYGNYMGYSLFRMFWLKKHMTDLVVKPHAYKKVRPNFYGHYKDLSPARSKELEKISSEGKKHFLSENVIKNRGLSSPLEMAHKVGKSKQYINMVIKKMNLKPVTQYKRQRFFDKEAQGRILAKVGK